MRHCFIHTPFLTSFVAYSACIDLANPTIWPDALYCCIIGRKGDVWLVIWAPRYRIAGSKNADSKVVPSLLWSSPKFNPMTLIVTNHNSVANVVNKKRIHMVTVRDDAVECFAAAGHDELEARSIPFLRYDPTMFPRRGILLQMSHRSHNNTTFIAAKPRWSETIVLASEVLILAASAGQPGDEENCSCCYTATHDQQWEKPAALFLHGLSDRTGDKWTLVSSSAPGMNMLLSSHDNSDSAPENKSYEFWPTYKASTVNNE